MRNSRLIKAYFIKSVEHLDIHTDEMIKLAHVFNARVCINLNPRNQRKAAFHVIQKIANKMSNDDFGGMDKAYASVCGEYHAEMDKRWLVDVDAGDMDKIEEITAYIELKYAQALVPNTRKIIARIPSKSGMHLIVHPFEMDFFRFSFPGVEIHRNNPTSMYIPYTPEDIAWTPFISRVDGAIARAANRELCREAGQDCGCGEVCAYN